MNKQCPEPGSWQAYIDEQVDMNQVSVMENHLRQCPSCSELLSSMISENQLLSQLFAYENQALNLRVTWPGRSLGDVGVTWGWIGGSFLILSVMVILIGSYLSTDSGFILWLQELNPRWLFTVAYQQLSADGWALLVDCTNRLLSASMSRISLLTALTSAGFGLVAMRLMSRLIVWQQEVF